VDLQFGIDTAAHIAAAEITGNTIVVLGGGFNNIFPTENINLFNKIIELGGLAISEYEPNEEAKSKNFPIRNRIITGISIGVLVIEAGYRSGASLTARIALKQGKKTFCIPCNIDSKNNKTNELISIGAKPINTVDEIIKDCGIVIQEINIGTSICVHSNVKIRKNVNIPREYKEIYKVLLDSPKHIDEICFRVKENIATITSNLTIMEIEGIIEELPGKIFKIL